MRSTKLFNVGKPYKRRSLYRVILGWVLAILAFGVLILLTQPPQSALHPEGPSSEQSRRKSTEESSA
eukprot:3757752-Pyramimonas_sp.AAC.3